MAAEKRGNIFLLVNIALLLHAAYGGPLRVCYYRYADRNGDLQVNDIETSLCTHIILGFAGLKDFHLHLPNAENILQNFTEFRKRDPNVKLLLSAGGGGGEEGFSQLVASPTLTERFIENMIQFLKTHGLDGIDLDWEFPAFNGSPKQDRPNFSLFLKMIRDKFDEDGLKNHKAPLLLTVAVGAPKLIVDGSYDVLEVARYADFINLMTYDLFIYQWYLPFTGHNAALHRRASQMAYLATLNTEWCANNWFTRGMPKSKIMVGIPTYGLIWKLFKEEDNGVGALATGRGDYGGGFIEYSMTCRRLQQEGYQRVFDHESKVPYAFKGKEWISYDDEQSVAYKAEWIKKNGFGGAMIFSLNSDDWGGSSCSNTTYPLLKTIQTILQD